MLVLTRIVGKSLRIGGGIKVHVLDVKGRQVKLGIDAPEGVPVLRSELVGKEKKK